MKTHRFTVQAAAVLAMVAVAAAQTSESAADLAARYLPDLIRLDSTNPPGNETRVARYLKQVADREGIAAELLGNDPQRLNFVARLRGSGKARPLLLIAHSDVVPADRSQWSVDPLAGILKDGYIYGRGAEDDKNLLAAELAVMVDLHRRKVPLDRDIILLSESDEEAGSLGATWVVANAWGKIDAEFALNEYSYILPTKSGVPVFQIQTAEKVPTRFKMTARGTAGHGSLPRDDNPVLHLARAIAKLSEAVEKLHTLPVPLPALPTVAGPSGTTIAATDVTGSVSPQTPSKAEAKPEVGRLPTVEGWVLRDVAYGGALIQSRRGLYEVYAGDMVPGLGHIDAVRRQDGHWVVVTSRGLIVTR